VVCEYIDLSADTVDTDDLSTTLLLLLLIIPISAVSASTCELELDFAALRLLRIARSRLCVDTEPAAVAAGACWEDEAVV